MNARVERMTDALNESFVALSRDDECRAAYAVVGITDYTEAEHEAACEDALLSRCLSAAQSLKAFPDNASEGEC